LPPPTPSIPTKLPRQKPPSVPVSPPQKTHALLLGGAGPQPAGHLPGGPLPHPQTQNPRKTGTDWLFAATQPLKPNPRPTAKNRVCPGFPP
jgi:hypothetical protein